MAARSHLAQGSTFPGFRDDHVSNFSGYVFSLGFFSPV
jgi:hypothetical protein